MDSTTTADHGGATEFSAIHPDIIQSHILNRLDGPTLASTGCTSAQFLSLCSEDLLWRHICNATWPSTTQPTVRRAISAFPSAHRSFYSDSFPSIRRRTLSRRSSKTSRVPETQEFISAIDVFCDDKLIYSTVKVTETLSGWFLSSPFRVDAMEPKEIVVAPLKFDDEEDTSMELVKERLRVSWILIDPHKKRAMNIASVAAVEARRHWLTEDMQLRYATVMEGGGDGELVQCAAVVTCSGKEGGELQVKEISMQVEDMEGKILTGLESLQILDAAMEEQRWKSEAKMQREVYEMFLRMKIQSRERKQQRERSLDMLCIAAGVAIFMAIWTFFYSR